MLSRLAPMTSHQVRSQDIDGASRPQGSHANSRARFCLFGAAPDTSNLGVSALHDSVIVGVQQRLPDCELTVFDHGRNPKRGADEVVRGVRRLGAQPTRRVWRSEAIANMEFANHLGGAWNLGARRLRSCSAVLDISAGDSFSDIYGPRRFDAIAAPKRMAIAAGIPLILLPQTYGPFRTERARAEAKRLVRGAAQAWARDPDSFEALRELLGSEFDSSRHRRGVDVAFGLPARKPAKPIAPQVEAWLRDGEGPVIGLNVSGLVYLDPARASAAFGIRFDYATLMRALITGLLERENSRVVLVPHVLALPGHPESDLAACRELRDSLGDAGERVCVLEGGYDASEIKELIGRLDWFCGTRMHATIAALSSGTPVAGLAYSPKFRGVFELCDMDHRVLELTGGEGIRGPDQLLRAFEERELDRVKLRAALPSVKEQIASQMDFVVATGVRG